MALGGRRTTAQDVRAGGTFEADTFRQGRQLQAPHLALHSVLRPAYPSSGLGHVLKILDLARHEPASDFCADFKPALVADDGDALE